LRLSGAGKSVLRKPNNLTLLCVLAAVAEIASEHLHATRQLIHADATDINHGKAGLQELFFVRSSATYCTFFQPD